MKTFIVLAAAAALCAGAAGSVARAGTDPVAAVQADVQKLTADAGTLHSTVLADAQRISADVQSLQGADRKTVVTTLKADAQKLRSDRQQLAPAVQADRQALMSDLQAVRQAKAGKGSQLKGVLQQLHAALQQERQATLAAATLSLAAQFLVVMTMIVPAAADVFSARELAEHFNRLGHIPPHLLVAEERIGSLVFYLDPRLRAELKEGQLRGLYADQVPPLRPGDMIAVPERQRARVAEYLDLAQNPYQTVGHYRLYHVASASAPSGPVKQ